MHAMHAQPNCEGGRLAMLKAQATLVGLAALRDFARTLAEAGRLADLPLERVDVAGSEVLVLARSPEHHGAVVIDAAGTVRLLRQHDGVERLAPWSLDEGTWSGADIHNLLDTLVRAMASLR
jgi:hypothetical protein